MKHFLIGIAIALASISSFANDLGTFNPLGGSWIYQYNDMGSFDNLFKFHTDTQLTLDTAITSYWGTINNFQSSLDGISLVDNQGTLTLSAGDHFFDVRGDSGLYGSGYNAQITAAVPEPETWAMMFAGLGLLGFMIKRRQS